MMFLATQRHAPESCPKHHEKVREALHEAWRRKDSHMPVGARLTAAYAEPLNHKLYLVFEAANIESVEQAVESFGLDRWGWVRIRRIEPLDDVLKRI